MKIDNEVIEILGSSRVEGNLLYLPARQLNRDLYVKVNKVLEALGGKWQKKLKAHQFTDDIEEKLSEVINTGEYSDKKKELQYFPTPQTIAEIMVKIADIGGNNRVLEPSCGRGAIVSEIIKKNSCEIIEIDKENHDYTINGYNCISYNEKGNVDFLSVTPKEEFDRIVMNPPFTKQQDVSHILHAWEFLKPGGILVSVCSPSPFFRDNKKSIDFRAFLEENNADVHDLPEGSFKESGTNIRTKLIKIKK